MTCDMSDFDVIFLRESVSVCYIEYSIYFDKEQTSALLISTVTLSLPPFLSGLSIEIFLVQRKQTDRTQYLVVIAKISGEQYKIISCKIFALIYLSVALNHVEI